MNPFLFLLLLSLPGLLSAQKLQKAAATYELNLSRSTLSEADACRRCQELAMVKAIEEVYGTVLIQGNTMILRNRSGQDSAVTDQHFGMLAESFVNGEWVETLSQSCERLLYEGDFWLRCEVKGRVAALSKPDYDIDFFMADCPETNCLTWEFQAGEDFYLHLTSAVDGFLSVYLSNGGEVQRLLPYRQIPEAWKGGMPVRRDQKYQLFSRKHAPLEDWTYVDEYVWDASEAGQIHRLYVVFSKEPHGKPILATTEAEGVSWPDQLTVADFQVWMAKQRRQGAELLVQTRDVVVR